jgi:hypothetical protein
MSEATERAKERAAKVRKGKRWSEGKTTIECKVVEMGVRNAK